MKRVYILCEGQTEETFVKEILLYHFQKLQVYPKPILFRTGGDGKGGVVTYGKLRDQILRLCKEDNTSLVTTMIDFFRLPHDTPGKGSMSTLPGPYEKISHVEAAIAHDIDQQNFLPNLLLHEFESLLFSELGAFSLWFDEHVVNSLQSESRNYASPEHINDNPETAPSKIILRHCPAYDKKLHGSLIAMDIGLDTIRSKCKHFDFWLSSLESLNQS